jgi:hypothetical protein
VAEAAQGEGGSFKRQLREGWPAALFVPALIFILHDWLHVIDDYAFVVIANNAAISDFVDSRVSRTAQDNGVVVALIDSETHAQRYSARSPLNRCELLKDIKRLYGARPEVLAIDLDISPAPGLPRSSARRSGAAKLDGDCEDEMYRLIKGQNLNGVRTVLMSPKRPAEAKVLERQCVWQADMRAARVEFGGADLPVSNGMTLEQYDDEASFGAAVRRARSKEPPAESRKCTSEAEPPEPVARAKRINALLYGSSICPVPLAVKSAVHQQPERDDGLGAETLCPASQTAGPDEFPKRLGVALDRVQPRVLFFGAGYGEDDVFFTPVGMLYGVEVHAAGYLSRIHPIGEKRWINLAGDILIAFAFSFSITLCWRQYFRNRMSEKARDRLLAMWWVIGLLVGFACAVYVTCIASYTAMRWAGIWLSPVPIAIGMLLDAFILGSVHVAIHTCHEQVNAAVRALQAATPESFATVAATTLKQARPADKSLGDSINRFFLADGLRLLQKGQYVAGATVFVRRAVWLCVLLRAAMILVTHP